MHMILLPVSCPKSFKFQTYHLKEASMFNGVCCGGNTTTKLYVIFNPVVRLQAG
jgi:hypothetical protein